MSFISHEILVAVIKQSRFNYHHTQERGLRASIYAWGFRNFANHTRIQFYWIKLGATETNQREWETQVPKTDSWGNQVWTWNENAWFLDHWLTYVESLSYITTNPITSHTKLNTIFVKKTRRQGDSLTWNGTWNGRGPDFEETSRLNSSGTNFEQLLKSRKNWCLLISGIDGVCSFIAHNNCLKSS